MNVITINQLKSKQGDFELNIDELNIPKGYITGLIGENGSGKTSLIYHLLNLRVQDTGEIKIFDRTFIEDREYILSNIGIVYSENHFPDFMNPKSLEKIFIDYYVTWDSNLYAHYLDKFEIPMTKKIKTLSQGMKIKLNIATAMSHKPKLLILDEPTSNLDPTFRIELLNILQDLMLDEDQTILFSTHITSDLEQIADYIAFIEEGRLMLYEEKDHLLEQYHIIEGDDLLLDDELDQLLIGTEFNDKRFKAMTKDADVFRELFGDKVIINPITIDQMMYFSKLKRLGVKHEATY
ncbi:ABC transporter ATP-binding protein [Abyssicoccus albus]|uniref:ABC-2 type transport system ATP-binding protein n=1 Tax=Abyssicoccus albus TaxID=1817405 RepID=A0A3N5BIV0_9BACL|nr:ABC transporter ATP-binding protein [Abyssicoccus albus]RPF57513.1 ABC-2 type transport system ATP-binding protein [Abyssicoccus albus]